MAEPELLLLFVRPLNRADVRYMVTGSVAAIFYGEPRLTHDVDLVAFLNDADIRGLAGSFPAADFYLPPPEVIAAEAQREQRGHFNIIHSETGFKADVYPTGRDDLNAWAFRLRRRVQFEGETVNTAARAAVRMAIGFRLTDRVRAGNVVSLFRWNAVLNCLHEDE